MLALEDVIKNVGNVECPQTVDLNVIGEVSPERTPFYIVRRVGPIDLPQGHKVLLTAREVITVDVQEGRGGKNQDPATGRSSTEYFPYYVGVGHGIRKNRVGNLPDPDDNIQVRRYTMGRSATYFADHHCEIEMSEWYEADVLARVDPAAYFFTVMYFGVSHWNRWHGQIPQGVVSESGGETVHFEQGHGKLEAAVFRPV